MQVKQHFQTNMALGSDVTLTLVTDNHKVADSLFTDLWRQIYLFERRFSRFLPASELSAFNRSAGLKTAVSPEFAALLTAARDIGLRSGGLFNPFILPALQRAGYTKSFVKKYQNDPQDIYTGRRVAPVDALELGDGWARIPFATALDMGGCGKGYLADQLAARLPRQKVAGFWFSIGGDIAAGGVDDRGNPWAVHIQDTAHPDQKTPYTIQGTIADFAVATSGTSVRKGDHNGKSWHHIINPLTGQPADTDITLATVHATSALDADVFASCAIIVGAKKAVPFLRQQQVKGAVLQVAVPQRQILTFGRSIRTKTEQGAVHA